MTVLEKLVYTKVRLSEAEKALSTVSVLLKECIIEYQQAKVKTVPQCHHAHSTTYPSGERVCNDCGVLIYA